MVSEHPNGVSIGLDVGSVSVKAVVLAPGGTVLAHEYTRHHGRPVEQAAGALARLIARHQASGISRVAVTGSGGKVVAECTGAAFVNEVAAAARAAFAHHSDARTIIDIGGEDSKLIFVNPDGSIRDFAMNTSCAAGTGSFLDEQAARLRLSIEEFAEAGLKSELPPRVAGRCSVFAKSDMIHLQQMATPDYDIIAGLAYAMARNFKSNLGKGMAFPAPILFIGGVAANACVVRALKDVLELSAEEFLVPPYHTCMGAVGAALVACDGGEGGGFRGVDGLIDYISRSRGRGRSWDRLAFHQGAENRHYVGAPEGVPEGAPERIRCYLGIDVGSISTKVAVLDEGGNVLAKSYLMTAGRPIEAVRSGLKEIWEKVGPRLDVRGVGTTGSGRYLTGDLVGADTIRNEITAQARGAAALDPEVDTIFEIGGQDSKYVSLENGVVVDFAMNYVCAAGTGSFLEEQAERLGISIKGEFSELALSCENPVRLGERCTVFMQSDLVAHASHGASVPQLVSGLAYSIVQNYLNRVVGHRRIGRKVFFQGGTAANRAVVAAFEKVTGRPIVVPRHHDVTGAIGAALLAQEHQRARGRKESGFHGFNLAQRAYRVETFECKGCANSCEIKKVVTEGEPPLFYGSRCDRYNLKDKRPRPAGLEDLFAVREELLDADYARRPRKSLGAIGIPRALFEHDLLPFWKAFLTRLGFDTVVSPPTNREITRLAAERAVAEACFPVKIVAGHIVWLREQGVKRFFLPSIVSMQREASDQMDSHLCPYVQAIPYMMRATFNEKAEGLEFLTPVVEFKHGKGRLLKDMLAFGRQFGAGRGEVITALDAALFAQKEFGSRFEKRLAAALKRAPAGTRKVVIIGRTYNTCDRAMNLDLPKKLIDMGIMPVPMEALLLNGVALSEDWDNMYWRNGQRILAAAEELSQSTEFDAIYATNFGCGPDSFLTGFFQRAVGGKPVLLLEIDEHSADAGVITRLEAWLDSLANVSFKPQPRRRLFPEVAVGASRTLYIPHMCEHAHALAAAFRSVGIASEALPPSDEESILAGRRHTLGRECLPAIITTGDMVRKIDELGARADRAAFFMPSGTGPCRFGQYHKLHRLVLRDMGHADIPVFAPTQGRNFYQEFRGISGDPSRPGWQGLVAVDVLIRALYETRPYELRRGEADRVFQRCLEHVCRAIEEGDEPLEALRDCARDFQAIPADRSRRKPIVGVVGEIYVRHNEAANNQVVRRLEALGLEVELAGFCEWILYTNYMRRRYAFVERNFQDLFLTTAKDTIQRFDERRLGRPFRTLVRHTVEPPTRLLLDLAGPYMHDSFEGEAVLTVAKTVELQREYASGVVNVMPFTCMPGTISGAVLRRVHAEHDLFPILNVAYDGQEDGTYQTRLEAFAHQVKQYHEARHPKQAERQAPLQVAALARQA